MAGQSLDEITECVIDLINKCHKPLRMAIMMFQETAGTVSNLTLQSEYNIQTTETLVIRFNPDHSRIYILILLKVRK